MPSALSRALRPARAVPPAVFLAAGVLAPPPSAAQFSNAGSASGLQWAQVTWGAALADLDGDGDLDAYAGHHYYSPWLYWNDGTGVFSRFAHPQPFTGPTDRHGLLLLPLRDGELPDLMITHGADGGAGTEPNELYRNDGTAFAAIAGAGGMADLPGRGRAVSAADVDGDGDPDLWEGKAPDAISANSLWRNDGNLSFTDVAAASGLAEMLGTVGGLFGDLDEDGDPDLLAGGEEFERPTVLWRNDGGTFVDASSGFAPALPVISGADLGDFDNDGDLDLAVCDGSIGIFDTFAEGDSVRWFFNSRFADTGLDGLTIPALAETVYADLRIRGLPDLGATHLGPDGVNPPAVLPFVLTDAYVGAPSFTPGVDRGIWIWRVSPGGPWELRCSTPQLNFDTFDGWVTDGTVVAGTTPLDLEDPSFTPGRPRVWRNDGGVFAEVTDELGLPTMLNPRDVSWVDYDNDGDLDLHVVDTGTSAAPNAPDALLRNDGAAFVDVAAAEGLLGSTAGMGDGGVWGDVDDDLDLDLYLLEGAGPLAFSLFGPSGLRRNDGDRGTALLLDLVAAHTSPPALGAKVRAHAGDLVVHRRVAANAFRGFQDPLRVHLGLGGAAACDSLAVTWPSGVTETWRDVPAGRYRLVEGDVASAVPTGAALPAGPGWTLEGVWPQPARGAQYVRVRLARPATLAISVFDVAGRRVARLHDGNLPAGAATLAWTGRDAAGRVVADGVYFVRVHDGRRGEVLRAVRLRP